MTMLNNVTKMCLARQKDSKRPCPPNGSGFDTLLVAYPASYPVATGDYFPGVKSRRCMKLTTHLHQMPRLTMLCLHSPSTSSWGVDPLSNE